MRLCASRSGGEMSLGWALLLSVLGAVFLLVPPGVTCQEEERSSAGGAENPSKNNESLLIPPEAMSNINGTVDFVVDYIDRTKPRGGRMSRCVDKMRFLMGHPPHSDKDIMEIHVRPQVSLYFNFLFAYHMGIPALDNWKETYSIYADTRPAYINIWEVMRDYFQLLRFQGECYLVQSDVSDFNEDPQDEEVHSQLLKRIHNCLESPLLAEVRTVNPYIYTSSFKLTNFEVRVFEACRSSMNSMMIAHIYSFNQLSMNQQELPFQYAPFPNMEADVDLMETEIMEMREEMEKRIGDSYKAQDFETFNRLQLMFTPVMLMADSHRAGTFDPYESLNSKCKICGNRPGYGQTIKDMREQSMQQFMDNVLNVWTNSQMTLGKQWSYYELISGVWSELDKFVADLDAGELDTLYNLIVNEIHGKPQPPPALPQTSALWVQKLNLHNILNDPMPDNHPKHRSIHTVKFVQFEYLPHPPGVQGMHIALNMLAYDGLWHWNYWNNGIHNLRMAWDLLGALHEEMKCLLGRSYYAHLRQKAVQNTQLDLENGALFSGISRTISKPCRIVNESDLVSPYCTRANHEICAPAGPLHPAQRTDSPIHGGLSLLKPKWYFKPDGIRKYRVLRWNNNKPNPNAPSGGWEIIPGLIVEREVCVGRRDYVMLYNLCRCGFRLDCGKDLNMNITCQLVENDLLRGQCRGSVGYPCKSLPLAPGKHDESCKSGYCNMKKNSCEDKPYIYHQDSGSPLSTSPWKLFPTIAKNSAILWSVSAMLLIS